MYLKDFIEPKPWRYFVVDSYLKGAAKALDLSSVGRKQICRINTTSEVCKYIIKQKPERSCSGGDGKTMVNDCTTIVQICLSIAATIIVLRYTQCTLLFKLGWDDRESQAAGSRRYDR